MACVGQRSPESSTGLSTESVDNLLPEPLARSLHRRRATAGRKRPRQRVRCDAHLVFCNTITALVYLVLLVVLVSTVRVFLTF